MSIIACSVDGCEKSKNARGWCVIHYNRWKRHGDPLVKTKPKTESSCSLEDCERERYGRMDVCSMHYKRMRKNGTYDKVKVRKFCTIEGCEDPAYGKEMCRLHWKRWWRNGTTDIIKVVKYCTIEGCEKPRVGGGLCSSHYTRNLRTGSPTTRYMGEIVDGKKICPRCKIDTPIGDLVGANKVYCRPCANAKAREWASLNPSEPIVRGTKKCDYCGSQFYYNNRRSIHCSVDCSRANRSSRDKPNQYKRRAIIKEAIIERFSSREIYERDGWVCQLCGLPVETEVSYLHRLSPTLDHIYPLSKGGLHMRSNVQTAHRSCNSSKGAKLPS